MVLITTQFEMLVDVEKIINLLKNNTEQYP